MIFDLYFASGIKSIWDSESRTEIFSNPFLILPRYSVFSPKLSLVQENKTSQKTPQCLLGLFAPICKYLSLFWTVPGTGCSALALRKLSLMMPPSAPMMPCSGRALILAVVSCSFHVIIMGNYSNGLALFHTVNTWSEFCFISKTSMKISLYAVLFAPGIGS